MKLSIPANIFRIFGKYHKQANNVMMRRHTLYWRRIVSNEIEFSLDTDGTK